MSESEEFDRLVKDSGLENPTVDELATQLLHARAEGANLLNIIALLAARTGGHIEFTGEEWNTKLTYTTIVFGEDAATDKVTIQFS